MFETSWQQVCRVLWKHSLCWEAGACLRNGLAALVNVILGRQGPGSLDGFWGWPFWSGICTFSEDYLNFSSTSPNSHLLSTRHPELLLKGCPIAFVTLGFAVSSMLSAPAYSNYHPTSCNLFLITARILEKPLGSLLQVILSIWVALTRIPASHTNAPTLCCVDCVSPEIIVSRWDLSPVSIGCILPLAYCAINSQSSYLDESLRTRGKSKIAWGTSPRVTEVKRKLIEADQKDLEP